MLAINFLFSFSRKSSIQLCLMTLMSMDPPQDRCRHRVPLLAGPIRWWLQGHQRNHHTNFMVLRMKIFKVSKYTNDYPVSWFFWQTLRLKSIKFHFGSHISKLTLRIYEFQVSLHIWPSEFCGPNSPTWNNQVYNLSYLISAFTNSYKTHLERV